MACFSHCLALARNMRAFVVIAFVHSPMDPIAVQQTQCNSELQIYRSTAAASVYPTPDGAPAKLQTSRRPSNAETTPKVVGSTAWRGAGFVFVDGATIRIYLIEVACNSNLLKAEPPSVRGLPERPQLATGASCFSAAG